MAGTKKIKLYAYCVGHPVWSDRVNRIVDYSADCGWYGRRRLDNLHDPCPRCDAQTESYEHERRTPREAFSWWFWGIINRITGTEMAEGGWRTVPHCCGQARCWMHYSYHNGPWCDCVCRWCRIARRLRPNILAIKREWKEES